METNKLNSLFYRILEKTSFEYLDLDQNNQVSHEEILYYAYKDEELRAELEDADLEMIKDYISFTDNKSSENQASETEDTSTLNSINTALSKLNSSEMQLLTLLFSMLLKSTSLNTSDLTTLLTKLLSETNSLNKDMNENKD